MGSRHGNKKLGSLVRARMALTGESYQRARARILQGAEASAGGWASRVDLIAIRYAGTAATVATFEIAGRLSAVLVKAAIGPLSRSPIFGFSPSRLVH